MEGKERHRGLLRAVRALARPRGPTRGPPRGSANVQRKRDPGQRDDPGGSGIPKPEWSARCHLKLAALVAAAGLCIAQQASGAQAPRYPLHPDDRIRLAEANRLRRLIEERVWPGWGEAPFALLLVTDSVEFLLWHPSPSAEFTAQGHDSLLGTEVFVRPRKLPPNLLATFPAVGAVPTIVIGQPARTRKRSSEWVITVLHEHFHQLQFSRPGYYAAVDGLGLARGDQSGMWMLNYPFPYDSLPIQQRAKATATALANALDEKASLNDLLPRIAAAYQSLRKDLSADDRRYLDFQLWQEGVARYVEYRCARLAADGGAPTAAFASLPDYTPYAEVADWLHSRIIEELRTADLKATQRILFYPLGAALALLLDRVTPDWKATYFTPMLTLERYFPSP